ncbi:MAG: hypothetical protein WHX93_12305 [bacterium]
MRGMMRIVVNQDQAQAPTVTLMAFSPQGGDWIPLTEPCASEELLEAQVQQLHETLKKLVLEARAVFASASREPLSSVPESPEEIWKLMESKADLGQMKLIFNGLEERRRRDLADYILTHANVFKGAGALFAQHYEEEGGILV